MIGIKFLSFPATIIKGTLARQNKVDGTHVGNDGDADRSSAPPWEESVVACPSCSDLVPGSSVNAHLDECLASCEDLEKDTQGANGNRLKNLSLSMAGIRALKSQSQQSLRTDASSGDSEHQRGNFEGRNTQLSPEVSWQFHQEFSTLQSELKDTPGTNGNRASQSQESLRTDAPSGDSEHQKGHFEGQKTRFSTDIARQFHQEFSALQSELEGIKDSFTRFESRMRKVSVAIAAHLGEEAATLDTNSNNINNHDNNKHNGECDSEHIRNEEQV